MNIILHPWRLASEPVPKELQGKPLLIEDFLGNYTVGYFSEDWWLAMLVDNALFKLYSHIVIELLNSRLKSNDKEE